MFRLLFVFAMFYGLGFAVYLSLMPEPRRVDQIAEMDGIVIFTGSSGRVRAGFEWAAANPGVPILVSGVHPDVYMRELMPTMDGLDQSDLMSRITLDKKAGTTQENVRETLAWAQEKNLHTIGLITSGAHMPRSRLLFFLQDTNLRVIPLVVEAPVRDIPPFLANMQEYMKLTVAPFLK